MDLSYVLQASGLFNQDMTAIYIISRGLSASSKGLELVTANLGVRAGASLLSSPVRPSQPLLFLQCNVIIYICITNV